MYKTKVFFTAAFEGKQKYQNYYDLVVKALKQTGVDLVATELGNYKKLLTLKQIKKAKNNEELHYMAIKQGIEWADLVVLELSCESFQVGHEATMAMLSKKHVLGLSTEIDWSKRIIHDYFHAQKYTKYNLKEKITEFINKYRDTRLSERINLFISQSQEKKLELEAKKRGLNKSELIRGLIDRM